MTATAYLTVCVGESRAGPVAIVAYHLKFEAASQWIPTDSLDHTGAWLVTEEQPVFQIDRLRAIVRLRVDSQHDTGRVEEIRVVGVSL